eukprot:scaffold55358_cov28-Prasinocladus_malaysianus.AAC.1
MHAYQSFWAQDCPREDTGRKIARQNNLTSIHFFGQPAVIGFAACAHCGHRLQVQRSTAGVAALDNQPQYLPDDLGPSDGVDSSSALVRITLFGRQGDRMVERGRLRGWPEGALYCLGPTGCQDGVHRGPASDDVHTGHCEGSAVARDLAQALMQVGTKEPCLNQRILKLPGCLMALSASRPRAYGHHRFIAIVVAACALLPATQA